MIGDYVLMAAMFSGAFLAVKALINRTPVETWRRK